MVGWIGIALAAVVVTGGVIFLWRRRRAKRLEYYRELAVKRRVDGNEDFIELQEHTSPPHFAAIFRSDLLLRIDEFTSGQTWQKMRDEALATLSFGKRSYIPTHKKGRTLSYERMHQVAPACLTFYHSKAMKKWVSEIVGENVVPAGDHDQSAASILFYDQPGDHIQWHYDHNYYDGRQFTVLLSLVNHSGNGNGASASMLQRSHSRRGDESIPTEENTLVIFEGGKVRHRVTPTEKGDLRVVLSMTYNTAPRIRWYMEAARRVKDMAFHGVKVLWD